MTDVLAAYGATAVTAQAVTDARLVELWLHGRPPNTAVAYALDLAAWHRFSGNQPLGEVTLSDLQGYVDSLGELAPATQARRVNVVKSLFGFAQRIGYLAFNVAGALRPVRVTQRRAERILSEFQVASMLVQEKNPRNRALLRMLYLSGLRVSELCALRWRDLQPREQDFQVTVVQGKGGKGRTVLLPGALWAELASQRGDAGADGPVFKSRKLGGHLDRGQVTRIVRAAAARVGIDAAVSSHWLRHAHASHGLDRGAPLHLIQATLGHASIATTSLYLHARPTDSSAMYLSTELLPGAE